MLKGHIRAYLIVDEFVFMFCWGHLWGAGVEFFNRGRGPGVKLPLGPAGYSTHPPLIITFILFPLLLSRRHTSPLSISLIDTAAGSTFLLM